MDRGMEDDLVIWEMVREANEPPGMLCFTMTNK